METKPTPNPPRSLSNTPSEKTSPSEPPTNPEKGEQGYILDTSLAQNQNLKTTKDGKTVLIPQPSNSPNDPLNWSPFRKHLILIIISLTAFLPDYGSATGAVTLIPQAAYAHLLTYHQSLLECM